MADGSSKTYNNPATASKALKELGRLSHAMAIKSSIPQIDNGWNIMQHGQRRRSRGHAGPGDTEKRLERHMSDTFILNILKHKRYIAM